MKYFLFTVVSFFIFTNIMHAQHVNIGAKGGLNLYSIKGDNIANYEAKVGYHLGLLGHIHMSNQFALQPEIVYSVQGAKYNNAGTDVSLNLNYLNIPVLLEYMFNNGFRLEAGPQIGLLTGGKAKTGSSNIDVKDNYKGTDFGLVLGMSYIKPSTGWGFDIRYNFGFPNINTSEAVSSYNGGLQAGIFYLFGHKS